MFMLRTCNKKNTCSKGIIKAHHMIFCWNLSRIALQKQQRCMQFIFGNEA